MAGNKTDIFVFADWLGMNKPELLGVLSAHQAKGRKAFGFEYDKNWLKTKIARFIDPDLQFLSGQQFPSNKRHRLVYRAVLQYFRKVITQKKRIL